MIFNDPIDDIWANAAADYMTHLNKSQFPYDEIKESWWCALAMIYEVLARKKQIPALSQLSKEKKQFYWNIALTRDTTKIHRIWICQALYVFDILNSE